MVVEDHLRSLRGELRRERTGFTTPWLAVVGPPHPIRPTVAVSRSESDPVLREDLLELLAVDSARIAERIRHAVAENLLEPARREVLATQRPVRLRLFRVREDIQSFVSHHLVVELMEAVPPGGKALKALPREVVVIGYEDVRVCVPAGGVGMHDHEEVRTVQPFSELDRDVADTV